MKKIVFETYKLKHPDTGLYHFTKELAEALVVTKPKEWEVEFYGRKEDRAMLPHGAAFRPIRWWHRLWLTAGRDVNVWHSPYQGSPYRPKGSKIILTIHDLNFLYEKNEKKRAKRLKALQDELDRADRVVAISGFTAQDLARNINLDKHPKIEVIHNGCNKYAGLIETPAQKPDRKFLFGVGTILPKKNWHVAVELLVGNDLMLYIAGKPSSYGDRIMDEARRLGVEDRVHLLGSISEAEKHWYLSNCEAFVFPSLAEGFGLPVIEAMAHGQPIFLSPHTSLREVGGDRAYYLPEDFDPPKMRQAFIQGMAHFAIHGDPDAQREYALSFSWTKAAKRYWELYEELDK